MDDEVRNVRQIAALAGVSTATVSRVYRGVGAVSPQMRARVLAAIETYNYRPSHFGEALARRRHGAIGIVFPGLSGPYFAELIEGLDSVAVTRNLSVHVLGAHHARSTADDLFAMARRVDGILVHGGTVSTEVVHTLSQQLPVVQLGADPGSGPVSVRTHDTMLELVQHLLLDHGRRRLVFVGNPMGSPDVTVRWNAFQQAHRDAGIEPPSEPLRTGLQQSDGVISAQAVLDGGYDGAVCANDETALGLLVGVLGQGIAVPDRLAITGVDDVPMASLVTPGLTTIRRPLAAIATTAAQLLLDLIDGHEVSREIVLESTLLKRGSCGCHARSDH